MNQEDYQLVLESCVEKLIRTAEALTVNSDYDAGKSMAYYEILSSIWNQSQALGVDPASIGFQGFNPDQLLKSKKAA